MPEISTRDLANRLGVTRSRLAQYATMGMPKLRRGWYDEDVAVKWVEDYRTERKGMPTVRDEGEATIADARLRYVNAQALGQEKRNALYDGTTVLTETVVTVVRQRDAAIIAGVSEWVTRAANGKERAMRQEIFDGFRTAVTSTIESFVADISSGDSVAATRTRSPRRVG